MGRVIAGHAQQAADKARGSRLGNGGGMSIAGLVGVRQVVKATLGDFRYVLGTRLVDFGLVVQAALIHRSEVIPSVLVDIGGVHQITLSYLSGVPPAFLNDF